MPKHAAAIDVRLMGSIIVDPATSCWLWQKSVSVWGYPVIGIGSRSDGSRNNVYAHRLSYECFVGSIPEGYEVDHLCRTRHCINPSHLEPVTKAENTRRSSASFQAALYQKAKTHCPHGHAYSPENTLHRKNRKREWRLCRECHNAYRRRLHSQKIRARRESGDLVL